MARRTQADRVIARFGSPQGLKAAFETAGVPGRDLISIYRWRYPRSKGGTDGQIPNAAWDDIHRAARIEGIVLTAEDLDPRPVVEEE